MKATWDVSDESASDVEVANFCFMAHSDKDDEENEWFLKTHDGKPIQVCESFQEGWRLSNFWRQQERDDLERNFGDLPVSDKGKETLSSKEEVSFK